MSPFWQAAGFVLVIFVLGFVIAMGLVMFEHPATKKRDKVLLCFLVLMIPCFILLARNMEAMRGAEFLTNKDFILDMRYEIIDQEIQHPDGSFVLAIRDDKDAIKFYQLRQLPTSRVFVPRLDRITHKVWYEAGAEKGQ